MTERDEAARLLKAWEKTDLHAKDFVGIDAALARARRSIRTNKHWTKLKDMVEDISLAVVTHQ